MTPMATDHAQLFARYKRAVTTERELRDPVKDAARAELLAGTTTKELAEKTGLTVEFFRKLAREVGAERQKAPTVGKDAPPRSAGPVANPNRVHAAED
jgi:hypothetical protein